LEKCIFCRHLAEQQSRLSQGKAPKANMVPVPPTPQGGRSGQLKRCRSWPSALQPWLPLKGDIEFGATKCGPTSPHLPNQISSPLPGSFRREMEDLLEGFPPSMRDVTPTPQARGGTRGGAGSALGIGPPHPTILDAIVSGLTLGVRTPSKAPPPVASPVVSHNLRTALSSRSAAPHDDSDGQMYHF
jgi:hypothetical protein